MDRTVLLETARMVLRNFRSEDDTLLFELDSDPEVMRFISKGKPTTLDEIRHRIIPRVLSYYSKSPPQGVWAAELRATGEFIGWFHLRPDIFSPEEMELGYRLKRNVWGKGFATEGSTALLAEGLGHWKYSVISARTLAVNSASRRVMEKVGMSFAGDFFYPAQMLPDWTEDERRGVKYTITSD